jgi:hypothetical protein
VIENLLQPGSRTTLDIVEVDPSDLPDSLFDPEELGPEE